MTKKIIVEYDSRAERYTVVETHNTIAAKPGDVLSKSQIDSYIFGVPHLYDIVVKRPKKS